MIHHRYHSPSDSRPTPNTPRPSNTFPVFSFNSPPTTRSPSPSSRTDHNHARTRSHTGPSRRTASIFSFRSLGTALPGINISHASASGSGRNADENDQGRGRGRRHGRGRSDTRSAEPLALPPDVGHGIGQPPPPTEATECGYVPRPEGMQSTPTLLLPNCSAAEEDVGEDTEADSGPDVAAAQVGTATAIRIPFLDEDEVSRLHPPAREVRVQRYHRHQRNRQHQLSSSSSIPRALTASPGGASISSLGGDDGDAPAAGGEMFDVDTAVRVSMISLGLGRLENTNDHPGPLCSNPPRDAASITTDVEMKFDEISLGTRRSRPLSQVYDLNLDLASASPCPSPAYHGSDAETRSFVPMPRSPALSPSSVNDEEADFAHLQTTLAALLAANTALMTLKAAHEQTIAYHEGTISAHKDSIAELSRQLRDHDEEQASLAKSACKEMESLNEENATLREERWNLMGRVAELEQTTARMEALLRLGGQMGGSNAGKDDWPLRGESSSASDSGSTLQCFSSPVAQGPWAGNGGVCSPDTLPSSLPSPGSCRRNSTRGFYAASPTPGGRSGYSAIHRRQRVPPQVMGAEERVVYSVEQTRPGTGQVASEEQRAAVEEHNVRLHANTDSQDALIQGLTSIPIVPSSTSAALPIPELPVLTYTKSGAVWLDRITTIFKYLGLLDFLQGVDQRPNPSASPAAADWAARRLRAAILLKHAVDDAILEDVLYLHRRRDNQDTSASGNNPFRPLPATEDPRRLLKTILMLSRTVPSSPTDLSWIDRIDSSDFDGADGFDGFASLVLCVDRRHSLLYGTSLDHYEVLLPRIQECMARLFPGQEGMALFGDPESIIPRKRWQLTVWMAKVVKRRRVEDY